MSRVQPDYSLAQDEIKLDGTVYMRRRQDGRNRHIRVKIEKRRETAAGEKMLRLVRVDDNTKPNEWVSEHWFREEHVFAPKEPWEDNDGLEAGEDVEIVDHPDHVLPPILDGALDQAILARVEQALPDDLFEVSLTLITHEHGRRVDVPRTVQVHRMQLTRAAREPEQIDPEEGAR